MLIINQCPVCNGATFLPLHNCKDNTVSHETFSVVVCQGCALGITSPRPENDQLYRYYLSEKYISHSGKSDSLVDKIYLLARTFTLKWKKKIVAQYASKGTLFDMGCGTGEFLSYMKHHQWQINGLEPSEIGRKKAEELTGITIVHSLAQLNTLTFDAITLWHVLEHIPDLQETIKSLHQHLTKSGKLFIAVPNYLSYDAQHYNENWAGYDVPRHLWHFSKESMEKLLFKNGFEVISIIPMKLDAFYVSILSERIKNRSSIQTFINGTLLGLRSNLAGKAKTNHSSLLYIAKPV